MVREFEGRLINEALRRTHGNKQAAARLLGLKRTTFSAKLRRCGVLDYEPERRKAIIPRETIDEQQEQPRANSGCR